MDSVGGRLGTIWTTRSDQVFYIVFDLIILGDHDRTFVFHVGHFNKTKM